ncbi:MAG: GxxExxY protein [Parafilimonas sp.]
MELNEITGIIIQECIKIHTDLGPGLFESVYEEILYYRLNKRNLSVSKQAAIPVYYEEIKMDVGFRADLIVEDSVIVEIKSIEALAPVHYKQLLTYLKLSGMKVGLLINFNEELLKKGIKRIVNGF